MGKENDRRMWGWRKKGSKERGEGERYEWDKEGSMLGEVGEKVEGGARSKS